MSLPGLQTDFTGDVIFLAIVREDANGEPADQAYAEWYADDRYDFNFPASADVGGNWLPFMGDGYPSHAIFDLTTMEYLYTRGGLMTSAEIEAKLNQYLR